MHAGAECFRGGVSASGLDRFFYLWDRVGWACRKLRKASIKHGECGNVQIRN